MTSWTLLSDMPYSSHLNEAVELLLHRIPDFATARAEDPSFMSHATSNDAPYLVFGDFAFFVREALDSKEDGRETHTWLPAAFQLIDELLTSPDPEVENLIQVSVLEVLADNPDTITVVKSHLSAPGKDKLDDWVRDFHRMMTANELDSYSG